MSAPDFVTIVVAKQDVLATNTAPALEALRTLISSPEVARNWHEKIDFAVDGYNNTSAELFEIAEVREFVQQLDQEFPYWLYFLSKSHLGLQCIAYCFLPPFLTTDAKMSVFPARLDELLSRRWFPAMNHICEWVGMSEQEVQTLSDRSVRYLLGGPHPCQ